MDRITAIKECKRFWRNIKKSGLSKMEYLEKHPYMKVNRYDMDCPLCEYAKSGGFFPLCKLCPLLIQYGKNCVELGFHGYKPEGERWFEAIENLKEE